MDLGTVLTLAASLWLSLPHGETAWDLLETTAPFTFADGIDGGGALAGVPARIGSDGSSWTQTTFRMGLADLTDPAGGRPLLYPDLSLFERVDVAAAGGSLAAGTPGAVVGLTARAGGRNWAGSASIVSAPAAFQSAGTGRAPPIARLRRLGAVEVDAGGAAGTSMRLFTAATALRSSHVEQQDAYQLPGDASSIAGHAAIDIPHGARVGVTGWIQQTTTAFQGRARFADRNVDGRQRYGGAVADWQRGSSLPLEVTASVASVRVSPDARSSTPDGSVERLVDGPVPALAELSAGSNQHWTVAAAVERRSTVRLAAGSRIERASARIDPLGSGPIGETIDGLPARAWDYGYAGESRRSMSIFEGHANASIDLTPDTIVEGGLRVDHLSASARGAVSGVGWTSLEPRAAVQWTPASWVFAAAARRYHELPPLALLSAGDPAGPQGKVFLWTDANHDGIVQDGERGPLVSVVGPGIATTIDPSIRRPHTDEAVVSIERRFGARGGVRFSGVVRRGRDLLALEDIGVPFSSYSVRTIFDPGLDLGSPGDDQFLPVYSRAASTFGADRYLLTNARGVTTTYGGVYLTARLDGATRWHLLCGATALRTHAPAAYRGYGPLENDDVLVGDAFSDPNSATFADGRTFFDRSYGVKIAATYTAPKQITIGMVARYADGQNFARLVLVSDLPQGPDVIRAYPNGASKFTYTMTVDVRAEKRWSWRRGDARFAIESYNLLDTTNEVAENTVTGARFRTPLFTQPPRVVRISLRIGVGGP